MRLRSASRSEPEQEAIPETPPSTNGDHPPEAPAHHDGPRLGDLLVGRDLISSDELTHALTEQTATGRKLGEVLVDLGLLNDGQLLALLSEQLSIPIVDLRRVHPDPDVLALLPESLVRSGTVLPISVDDGALTVAVSSAPSPQFREKLTTAAGTQVTFVLANEGDIRTIIDRSYRALSGIDDLVGAFTDTESIRTDGAVVGGLTGGTDDASPVAQLVNRIVTQAVRERASDIHIEPQETELRVRYRVDGALHDAVILPPSLAQALVSRIKILAEMNIVERRRSQDGQMEITVDGRELDVRVATMATIWGEKVVMRVLDRTRSLFALDKLGMSAQTQADFSRLIRSPFGMVICAGPTGSGKTTTLYAALNQIADAERNVTTIEDPVEYVFPGINQIQINEQADITFSGGLKAILRQDPDVILVGEMRDVETARIAVQSALTGHLVLSSLHATDATAALHRFLDMGIESFLVSSSVVGVVAQRLVRRICESCREPFEPTADELAMYEEWGGKPKNDFTHGVGCNFCAGTGYVDRVGVYELLKITPAIKQLIVDHAPRDVIHQCAIDEGMTTLREEALRVIEEDVTTISDVLRSVYIS
jgi:type IV pilus assembly protein PilB